MLHNYNYSHVIFLFFSFLFNFLIQISNDFLFCIVDFIQPLHNIHIKLYKLPKQTTKLYNRASLYRTWISCNQYQIYWLLRNNYSNLPQYLFLNVQNKTFIANRAYLSAWLSVWPTFCWATFTVSIYTSEAKYVSSFASCALNIQTDGKWAVVQW